MTRIARYVACAGLFCLAGVPRASADPITITAGFLTADRSAVPSGTTSLVGTRGFSLEARVSHREGNVRALNECDPCAPGGLLSVGGILSGSVFSGVATLDGVTYPEIESLDAPASLYFEFFGSLRVPAFQTSPVTLTAPFTTQGLFFVPGGSAALTGRGIATVVLTPFSPIDERLWAGQSIRYDFETQTPVPEPSTVLLIGGGLLTIVRAARRGRAVKHT
jgi:PEP-CTERM motif